MAESIREQLLEGLGREAYRIEWEEPLREGGSFTCVAVGIPVELADYSLRILLGARGQGVATWINVDKITNISRPWP